MPAHEWNGSQLRFRDAVDSWGNYVDLRGPRGLQGERGLAGAPSRPRATFSMSDGRIISNNVFVDWTNSWEGNIYAETSGIRFTVRFGRSWFALGTGALIFESNDCTGQAYLESYASPAQPLLWGVVTANGFYRVTGRRRTMVVRSRLQQNGCRVGSWDRIGFQAARFDGNLDLTPYFGPTNSDSLSPDEAYISYQ